MKPMRDFELEKYFSKWEFKARYNLGGSDVQSMTLNELLDLAEPMDREQWDNLYLGYTETSGLPELREVIADTYETMTVDNILCFAGAEEGIFCAMHALLSRDDHAVICYPNYQSTETIPLNICDVTGFPLMPDQDWTIDIEELLSKIRSNTKLISINFPNNPTGKILEKNKFDTLINLCQKRGIYLFSDEVYRLIERDKSKRLPQAADIYERALSLNVMSKVYGMAGLRIGWIASKDRYLLDSIVRKKHYLSICNSGPSEILAKIALKAQDMILKKNRALVEKNLMKLNVFFDRLPELFEWYQPDGGCVGFPRYLGHEGVERFTKRLVEEVGIIMLPASIFRSDLGSVQNNRFRIGFGRSYFADALEGLQEYLRNRKI